MAQDILRDFGTLVALTISLDGLGDDLSATSSAVDLGTPGPTKIGFEIKVDSAGADTVDVYIQWSADGTDFSDENGPNDQFLRAIQMGGARVKVFAVEVEARHFKLRVENKSGASLSATAGANTAEYFEIAGDLANDA